MCDKKFRLLKYIAFICILFNTTIANAQQEKIKVAFPIQDGFHIADDHGNLSGYTYDYLMKIAQYNDFSYEFIVIDEGTLSERLTAAMSMITTGEADILAGINFNEDLLDVFEYSQIPIGTNRNTISVLDSASTINTNSYLEGENFSIALNSSAQSLNEDLLNYLNLNNIYPEIIYLDSQQQCVDMLYEGLVDTISSKEISETIDLINIATFSSENFYFVSSAGNTDLIESLDNAIRSVQEDDPYTNNILKEKYFTTAHSGAIYFFKEDIAFLDSLDVINVGFYQNVAPFYMYDPVTETSSGISVDILEEISKLLGIDFAYIKCNSGEQLTQMLESGEIDMIGAIYPDYSLASDLSVILSNPYVYSNAIRLNNSTKNVDMSTSKELYSHFISDNLNDFKNINDIGVTLQMLNTGQIDYVYANPYIAQYNMQLNDYSNVEFFQSSEITSNVCFGISKNASDRLAQFINHAILHISPETTNEIILTNSQINRSISVRQFITNNFFLFTLILSFLIFVVIFIIASMNKKNKSALYNLINKDQLTGLLTRYKFIQELEILCAKKELDKYVLISVDIDNFQYINEAYGYEYGSDVLVKFGNQLSDYFGNKSIIAREKDDTFLVLMPNDSLADNRDEYLNNISNSINSVLKVKNTIKTSQGIYFITDLTEGIPHMIDCAHSARLLGKISYDSTIAEFTEAMRLDRENKNKIVARMEEALLNYEFKVHYQSKVSLDDFKIVGAEALIRWFPLDGTVIYPDNFIPLFENNGFIINLDYFVFESVCKFIDQNKTNEHLPTISVNLSTITLLEPDLVTKLTDLTAKYRLDNDLIELEITESAIINNFEDIVAKINVLRSLDFSISMDDFGSGISSLNHLKNIDVDVLKIDKEFINDSLYGTKGIPIIKNVIAMSKDLNLLTVAEGVETRQHVELLKTLGCDIAQGYYFSKPITEENFLTFIKTPIEMDV